MQPYSIMHSLVYAGKRPKGTVGLFELIEKLPWNVVLALLESQPNNYTNMPIFGYFISSVHLIKELYFTVYS